MADFDATERNAVLAQGRKEGMATAALAIGLLSFTNLLGAEKGLLALVLGAVALSGSSIARGRARIAMGLGVLQLGTIIVVIILFHDKLAELLTLLNKLG